MKNHKIKKNLKIYKKQVICYILDNKQKKLIGFKKKQSKKEKINEKINKKYKMNKKSKINNNKKIKYKKIKKK